MSFNVGDKVYTPVGTILTIVERRPSLDGIGDCMLYIIEDELGLRRGPMLGTYLTKCKNTTPFEGSIEFEVEG